MSKEDSSKEISEINPFKLEKIGTKQEDPDQVFFNFVRGGLRVEIHGYSDTKYKIIFTDDTSKKVYNTFENVSAGEFRHEKTEFYVKWNVQVINEKDGSMLKEYTLDLKDKNVLISFESSALGDAISWVNYIEEFRKKHGCKIVCTSFFNELFKDVFPDIMFIPRGQQIQGIHVAYKLGWFGTGAPGDINPNGCHTIPLQKVSSDILGLPYKEERLRLKKDPRGKLFKQGKYVVITTCSTAQFKYWNLPGGWQQLVDWLVKQGYKVINIGKQPNVLRNVFDFCGKRELMDLVNIFQYSEFFVGLPSGLAWLNWAIGKKGVMITGISEPFCEYREDNYRVERLDLCHGCFNDSSEVFQKSLWLYCPRNQDDKEKRFECTKSISVDMVKAVVNQVRKDIKTKSTHYSMTDEACQEYIDGLDLEYVL